MKTRIYLIRHAQAAGNQKRTFQGRSDAPLSQLGEAQLEPLAQRFRAIPLDAVYTSPLLRARRTADAVNRFHGLPVREEPGLVEIDGGDFEGLRWGELPERYPAEFGLWENEPHWFAAPGGERMRAVYDRMVETVLRLAGEHPGEALALVSHGCAIRNYLCHARREPYEHLSQVPWAENTAVCCVDYDRDGVPTLVYENDASHLSLELGSPRNLYWWKE